MQVRVRVPSALQRFSEGRGRVDVELDADDGEQASVEAVLAALGRLHPGVRERALDEQGCVRHHVNVFANGESIRRTGGLATPVRAGDEIAILPAVSGG